MNDAAPRRRTRERGALAMLLHTHMPYVEGFGAWPFGEEWLWEAIASSYLPLLELLSADVPLTLSLTPVLCDQLEVADLAPRFGDFVRDVRAFTHAEDARGLRDSGHDELARELERAYGDYELAVERMERHGGRLMDALAAHASWTSSATHAILPQLASDALVRVQVRAGVDAYRSRVREQWRGGFWLPECAHAPHLEHVLVEAGVRASCVELTQRLGLGAREHLQPRRSDAGMVLVPIDRAVVDLVWGERGYPAHSVYRDYHRRTVHNHSPWRNDGGAYDHQRAHELARRHAADFVQRARARLERSGGGLPGGGLIVFAVDTELFGHWWYEGPTWLRAVVDECSKQELALVSLDDALATHDPAPLDARSEQWQPTSWGAHGDLSTWSSACGEVAEMAFAARAAELALLRSARTPGAAALRELLALQSSDWAFMLTRELAGPYARERFDAHLAAFERALADGPDAGAEALRGLAIHADPALLLEP
jgi:1,4-alpha-glucan branching enzyme